MNEEALLKSLRNEVQDFWEGISWVPSPLCLVQARLLQDRPVVTWEGTMLLWPLVPHARLPPSEPWLETAIACVTILGPQQCKQSVMPPSALTQPPCSPALQML